MKRIYLVDVSSMFFRAFYAVRPLTSPAGVPVNAVYGFLSMIIKLFKDEKPDHMVFCYDRKEPSFRKEMYEDYKAHRTEMPDDLSVQIPYIKKLADLLGIPSLEVPNYEADDIIGTLTHWGRRQKMQVVIVSGDKDFGQLITDNVILYDTMKDHKYDAKGVFEKWGIRPDQFIDYLAIVGDTSDNIPGVKGVGEKGAIKLLEQFKHVEDIYENIDKVESKSVREKLIASKDNCLLSKKLVTIACDIPVSENYEDYALRPWHVEELRQLLQELNFKTFEKNLLGNGQLGFALDTSAEPPPLVKAKETAPAIAVIHPKPSPVKHGDTVVFAPSEYQEVTGTTRDVMNWLQEGQELWGFQDSRGVFIATDSHVYNVTDPELLGKITDTYKVAWKGFDLKGFWHRIGAKDPKTLWDSMLAAYVIRAGDSSDFAKIYNRFVGEALPEFATPSQLLNAHVHLSRILEHELNSHDGDKVFKELDLPLAPVLLQMEKTGIRIDRELLKKQSDALATDLQGLEKAIHTEAGEAFNVGSPKQLGVILFEKLGLPAGKKTKTGYSTDTDVLAGLEHPIAKLVLQWRELAKLKSTYVDALPEMIDPKDDRVHTSFNQALTTTGRLSSTAPNLQNIPIRTARGQEVRKAFIAAPRMKLLSADYSQIELRILAHISEDPNLCRAFAEDLDIHAATAAEIYNVPLKDVTSDLRRAAKAVNFGIAYGQGAFGLAENLGIPRGEAKEIIDRYFNRFKNVRDYIEGTVKTAHEKGYVETLFGRRRYIEELQSKNMALKKFGERAAINAPIQGTASDLVKKAMIEVSQKVPVRMLLQVHDELIFEDFEDNLKQHSAELVRIMENVAQFKVPLKVNFAIGNNWDEAH
ncbi:DNA polymerase I [Bdellovibrio sp. HCB2-146]|uniref:DNA polymerase I n=1 Tax=Bdellovibrio sp. HCB2-146 TaxID=3394362 RepID=UPI0039BC7592